MNHPDYEQKLEAAVHGALRELPDLTAPERLMPRVIAALEHRATRPWYSQGWAAWPAPARAGALFVLAAVFAGIWWGGAQAAAGYSLPAVPGWAQPWLAIVGALRSIAQAVYGTGALIGRHLGPGVLVAAFLLLALAHGLCLGLGTLCVRFSFARSEMNRQPSYL